MSGDIKTTYGTWKEGTQAPGYSREFISCDFDKIASKTNTEELRMVNEHGEDNLLDVFTRRAASAEGSLPFLGTRVGNDYQWISYKETYDTAKFLAAGINELNLI